VSQPAPDDHSPVPDPDPLLEFFAEPEQATPAAAAPPTNHPAEPVVNAEDTPPPAVAPVEPEPDPELRRRLHRTERMLEKAQFEISALKSDVATLVTAIDDIKKRQSRPAEILPVPKTPIPPPRLSRVAAAAVTTIGIILVLVVWVMWSLPSDDLSDFGATDVQAAPEPVAEASAPAEIAESPPVAIQNAAAVSIVEPPPEPPPQPERATAVDRAEVRPRSSEPVEYVGTLSIDATPAGDVFLNRKRVGRTPMRLEGLRAGSHLIWIERDGFRRWTRVVPVAANRVSRVSAELDPQP
jgi:hypothetical protein